MIFKNDRYLLTSKWSPAGDQVNAIEALYQGFQGNHKDQVLLGVTGSGKTFTMAHVISKLNIPALILAPNKTLAAQLYEEMKELFPNNSVEYFVSYYDYYQPEAYKPQTNTYIPKESQRNARIDRLRHSATRALCQSKQVIVVASVSCIYGLGSAEAYRDVIWNIEIGQMFDYDRFLIELHMLQYVESSPNNTDIKRGTFYYKKVTDEYSEFNIYPAHLENQVLCVHVKSGRISALELLEDGILQECFDRFDIYPNTHHVVQKDAIDKAIVGIENELKLQLGFLRGLGKEDEAGRLEDRALRDMELLRTTLTCPGVENYSRFFTNREEGQPPPTLHEFFPKPFLCIADESHIMIPQLRAMANADRKRKEVLIEHGFRLPSCLDNRPLRFEEWNHVRDQTLFVSATPALFEMECGKVIEQVIRPTGLVDPPIEVRPTKHQLEDAVKEAQKTIEQGYRVIMLTLTKKMSERLTDYLISIHMKAEYIHADVKTLARVKILQNLRKGVIDIVVGINLLREGIDVPECALVVIFDADQAGYLRSRTALIQMIGRAARNSDGRVLLYADRVTSSMKEAMDETERRRELQAKHNKTHGIIPRTTAKPISTAFDMLMMSEEVQRFFEINNSDKRVEYVKDLEKRMKVAAENRHFDEAIRLRDSLKAIRQTGMMKKPVKKEDK